MNRTLLLVTLALAGASPLAGQQMVTKQAKLSAGQDQAQRAVMLFRDSVVAAQAALSNLERDYQKASPANLESRAATIARRCSGALRTLPTARHLLATAEATTPEQERGRDDMLKAMDRTKPVLGDCQRAFEPLGQQGKGEEVRGYGNQRAKPIKKGLSQFEGSVPPFSRAMGLDLHTVLRAGKSPVQ